MVLFPLLTSLLLYVPAELCLFDWWETPYVSSLLQKTEYFGDAARPIVIVTHDWGDYHLSGWSEKTRDLYVKYGSSERAVGRALTADVLTALYKLGPAAIAVDTEFAPSSHDDPATLQARNRLLAALRAHRKHDVALVLGMRPFPALSDALAASDPEAPTPPSDELAALYFEGLTRLEEEQPDPLGLRVGSMLVGRTVRLCGLQRKEVFLSVPVAHLSFAGPQPQAAGAAQWDGWVAGLAFEAFAAAERMEIEAEPDWASPQRLVFVHAARRFPVPAGYAGDPDEGEGWETWSALIRYAETEKGAGDPFPRFDYKGILSDGLSTEAQKRFRNAIVLIGREDPEDRFPTPIGELDGVEIHAHIANMLVHDLKLQENPEKVRPHEMPACLDFVPVPWQVVGWWVAGAVLCALALLRDWRFNWKHVVGLTGAVTFLLCVLAWKVVFAVYPAVAVYLATWCAGLLQGRLKASEGKP